MPDLIVTLHAGEPRRAWCDDCLLTSVIEIDVMTLNASGVSVLGTFSQCEDCGKRSDGR